MQARGIYGVVLFLWLLPITGIAARATSKTGNSHTQDSPTDADLNDHVLLIFTDSAGNPISPPDKSVLQLRIHGKPIEIEEVRSLKDSPLVFSMLVDVSGSTKKFAEAQIRAASRLFRDLSSRGGRGYLVIFRTDIMTNDRYLEPDEVDRALQRFAPATRTGSTALYDALIRATVQLSAANDSSSSHRAIFLFSDGGDDASRKSHEAAIAAAQGVGIPIFSIGVSPKTDYETTREMANDVQILKLLGRSTGGATSFLGDSDDVVAHVTHLIDGQCLLSFKRPALEPKKPYDMKVQSSAKDIRILAPTAYFPQ